MIKRLFIPLIGVSLIACSSAQLTDSKDTDSVEDAKKDRVDEVLEEQNEPLPFDRDDFTDTYYKKMAEANMTKNAVDPVKLKSTETFIRLSSGELMEAILLLETTNEFVNSEELQAYLEELNDKVIEGPREEAKIIEGLKVDIQLVSENDITISISNETS